MHEYSSRFDIMNHVFPFASGRAKLTLSHVHADFREALREKFITPMRETVMPAKMLHECVGLAIKTGCLDLCDLTLFAGEAVSIYDALYIAANENHRDMCELIHRWSQTKGRGWRVDWSRMLTGAHRELCELARQWAQEAGDPLSGNLLMCAAARAGKLDLCELSFSWPATECRATSWTFALAGATEGGHIDICRVAHANLRAPGRTEARQKISYSSFLFNAAYRGHREICILLREWALAEGYVPDYDLMRCGAQSGRHADLEALAREWDAA